MYQTSIEQIIRKENHHCVIVSVFRVILVRIFPHSERIRRDTRKKKNSLISGEHGSIQFYNGAYRFCNQWKKGEKLDAYTSKLAINITKIDKFPTFFVWFLWKWTKMFLLLNLWNHSVFKIDSKFGGAVALFLVIL